LACACIPRIRHFALRAAALDGRPMRCSHEHQV
jgi:hypothetical protein